MEENKQVRQFLVVNWDDGSTDVNVRSKVTRIDEDDVITMESIARVTGLHFRGPKVWKGTIESIWSTYLQ